MNENHGDLVGITMLDMKILLVIWLVRALAGCAESDVACEDGRSWNEFYESCVDPCPAHQDYDADGICSDVAPISRQSGAADDRLLISE